MTPTGTLFPNARMDTLYNGCDADLQDPCAVRIDGDLIHVEYEFDGERTVYAGTVPPNVIGSSRLVRSKDFN